MARNRGLSFYKRRKKISSVLVREIFSWIFGIVVAVFIAGVANYFLGMTTYVVGVSMEPALYNGQQIYINRFSYTLTAPVAGDVVVFLPNGNPNAHYYVKRIVAGPGDTVLVKQGKLYVNGEISPWVQAKIAEAGIAENEILLQRGEYFCLGDNPGNSEDSRSANIGAVKEKDIVGKAWLKMPCEESGIGLVK